MMTEEDVQAAFQHVEPVAVATASLVDIKRMRDKCLQADIPALMKRPCAKGGGWGTKLELLVKETDIPKLQKLLQSEWADSVEREGNVLAVEDLRPNEEGNLPCPACGMAAPLDADGACTDCGLVLA